jgi:imidazolonepropionase-like amidohydrolase
MMAADEPAIFERHSMAIAMGVNIAMGSDCGGNEARVHGFNVDELECYVRCGMTPARALQSATLDAARAIRLDSEIGSVEPGKLADLVIIDGDPTGDVSLAVTGVVGVIQGGEVRRDDLDLLSPIRTRGQVLSHTRQEPLGLALA